MCGSHKRRAIISRNNQEDFLKGGNMEELSSVEIEEISGGLAPWYVVIQWFSDFASGFADGWRDGARDLNNSGGGSDGWTMPNGESLPT